METKKVEKGGLGKKLSKMLALIPVAHADLTSVAQNAPGVAKGTSFDVALKLINFAITLIGVLGVIMFIYAGFLYMIAAGDEAKITKAKNTMTYSIVGLVVAVLGFVVVATVQTYIVKQSG